MALASAIFGDDAPERIATLSRFSLVEFRGADERLELPAPVRWYAYLRFKPAGFELDYGRVAFVMPGAGANVLPFPRRRSLGRYGGDGGGARS